MQLRPFNTIDFTIHVNLVQLLRGKQQHQPRHRCRLHKKDLTGLKASCSLLCHWPLMWPLGVSNTYIHTYIRPKLYIHRIDLKQLILIRPERIERIPTYNKNIIRLSEKASCSLHFLWPLMCGHLACPTHTYWNAYIGQTFYTNHQLWICLNFNSVNIVKRHDFGFFSPLNLNLACGLKNAPAGFAVMWIRIRIPNADQDPEVYNEGKNRVQPTKFSRIFFCKNYIFSSLKYRFENIFFSLLLKDGLKSN